MADEGKVHSSSSSGSEAAVSGPIRRVLFISAGASHSVALLCKSQNHNSVDSFCVYSVCILYSYGLHTVFLLMGSNLDLLLTKNFIWGLCYFGHFSLILIINVKKIKCLLFCGDYVKIGSGGWLEVDLRLCAWSRMLHVGTLNLIMILLHPIGDVIPCFDNIADILLVYKTRQSMVHRDL